MTIILRTLKIDANKNLAIMATVDRLSALPDDILHKILTLLSIEDSVRTSVLSSRWSRLCLTNSDLNFSFSHRFDVENLISVVDHCLILSSPTRKLRSVLFPVSSHPKIAAALRRWLRFAANRDVEEVVISPHLTGCDSVEIPQVLFDCRLMSSLKLQKCLIRSVPLRTEEENLKFLKTVVLAYVHVGNDTLNSLLSLCPMIETLALSGCSDLSRIVVWSPTLRSLTVYNCEGLNHFQIVWAPRLRRLMYDGGILTIKSMEGMSNLEEAVILSSRRRPFANCQLWKQFTTALAHVKVLSVNSWFFKFPPKAEGESENKIIFHNLKEFHWWPVRKIFDGMPWSGENFTEASICDLMSALQHCPVLEQLCMHGNYYYMETDDDRRWGYMEEASSAQEHRESNQLRKLNEAHGLLPRLKKVKMVDFSCNKEEIQLIKFVLSKADQLESVILYYVPEEKVPEEKGKLEEMHRVTGSLPKVSRHARVSLSEVPYDACPKYDTMWWQFSRF